jgi:3-hydroxybutyryl-CoA dehydrogenase
MRIFATGDEVRLAELEKHLGKNHELIRFAEPSAFFLPAENNSGDVLLIDLNLDDHPHHLNYYAQMKRIILIGCAVKKNLRELKGYVGAANNFSFFGMNTLPTFIDRSRMEVSFLKPGDEDDFRRVSASLNWEYFKVEDTVGMVTPRVVAMIINEACFTFDAGIASMEDIDKGMKLGTSYPYGPFEWGDRIGINNIYESLMALGKNSGNERYRISPFLEKKYLMKDNFYAR